METDVELRFSPRSRRFALPSLTAYSLLVVGWSLCLLLAYFHAYVPFVWEGLCWSCPHNFLWAAVLLSLWSVSACIITEQWTMHPEVRRLLRIWQNNYIVISPKTVKQFPRRSEIYLANIYATDFIVRLFECEKLEWGSSQICDSLLAWSYDTQVIHQCGCNSSWSISFFAMTVHILHDYRMIAI